MANERIKKQAEKLADKVLAKVNNKGEILTDAEPAEAAGKHRLIIEAYKKLKGLLK